MEIPWFGPLIPLLAFAHYWYLPVVGLLVVVFIALALVDDVNASRRNGRPNNDQR